MQGALRSGLSYEYTLEHRKNLSECNMQARGSVVSDYWAASQFGNPPTMWQRKQRMISLCTARFCKSSLPIRLTRLPCRGEISVRSVRSIVARAQTLLSIACVFAGFVSTSLMPDATVVDRGGLPCFSIPRVTRISGFMRLYRLQVTEQELADWKTLPVELLGF